MAIRDMILPEFDMEMANTRKTLERVPEDKLQFKPHEKSWTLAELATHVANIPKWAVLTFQSDSFDYAPEGAEPYKEEPFQSRQKLLAWFDEHVTKTRQAITEMEDDKMMAPWSLLAAGKPQFTMPKVAVYRSFVMNHLIHHRAQLTIYLRLNNVPVPALYGPSADEQS